MVSLGKTEQHPKPHHAHGLRPVRASTHFFAVSFVTIASLALYGVLQERVMTVPYERNPGGSWSWSEALTTRLRVRKREIYSRVVCF
jgi:hypothetical protein